MFFVQGMSIRDVRLKLRKTLGTFNKQRQDELQMSILKTIFTRKFVTNLETISILAHTARLLLLATEILSSVVSDEKECLAYFVLKIVVSDKNL